MQKIIFVLVIIPFFFSSCIEEPFDPGVPFDEDYGTDQNYIISLFENNFNSHKPISKGQQTTSLVTRVISYESNYGLNTFCIIEQRIRETVIDVQQYKTRLYREILRERNLTDLSYECNELLDKDNKEAIALIATPTIEDLMSRLKKDFLGKRVTFFRDPYPTDNRNLYMISIHQNEEIDSRLVGRIIDFDQPFFLNHHSIKVTDPQLEIDYWKYSRWMIGWDTDVDVSVIDDFNIPVIDETNKYLYF
ncbi:MAG: hypothetical protein NXH75_07085 [Halobacteriovoraceae bacterium]|nr:hypothetical protein [Halobacteriovoraceae bacterium]